MFRINKKYNIYDIVGTANELLYELFQNSNLRIAGRKYNFKAIKVVRTLDPGRMHISSKVMSISSVFHVSMYVRYHMTHKNKVCFYDSVFQVLLLFQDLRPTVFRAMWEHRHFKPHIF